MQEKNEKFKDKNLTRSLYLLLYVISWCDRINIYFRSEKVRDERHNGG